MSQEVEIEFKTQLNKSDYTKLIERYQVKQTDFFTQTNVYYDTPNFALKDLGMGLRIRLFETSAELTLKSPLANDATGLLETTDPLTLQQARELVHGGIIFSGGQVATFLSNLSVPSEELVVQANLTTKRFEKQLTPTALLVLDESWYHGQHDYELEMEVADAQAGELFFRNFLSSHKLAYAPTANKIQRAIKAKQAE